MKLIVGAVCFAVVFVGACYLISQHLYGIDEDNNAEMVEIPEGRIQPKPLSRKPLLKDTVTTADGEIDAESGKVANANSHLTTPKDAEQLETVTEEVVGEDGMAIVNGKVVDWEKFRLYRMHQNGWYKPEDVPIIHSPPVPGADGVYVWNAETGIVYGERPPHIKETNRELREALSNAIERKNGETAQRIQEELMELNEPYGEMIAVPMAKLRNIPDSWKPYFYTILANESGVMPPPAGLHSKLLERYEQKSKEVLE